VSTVALRFVPAAEHVRTARLVAVAVARRAGMSEEECDAVRLAVGEACARAVRRCRAQVVIAAMVVELDDSGPALEIVVTDAADATDSEEEECVALALVRDVCDRVRVDEGPSGGAGGRLRMVWDRATT
jgi:anti-sigma regulatory factor (Ser/Thr protein kinase)